MGKVALGVFVGAVAGFGGGVLIAAAGFDEQAEDMGRLRRAIDRQDEALRQGADAIGGAETVIRGLLRAPDMSETDRKTDRRAAERWLADHAGGA